MGFNIFGLGGGIDWDLYISSILQAEQEKIGRTIVAQEVKTTSMQTVFSNISSAMSSLRSSVNDFAFSGDFKTKSVASSNSTVITATASLAATLQSVSVDVLQTAKAEQHRLAFSGVDDSVTSGDANITITVRGVEHEIEVPAGSTMTELRNLINSTPGIGVNVSLYDSQDGTASPVRLTIQDKKLGDFDGDDMTDNITFDFSELTQVANPVERVVQAADTIVEINGEEVRRNTNTINDVIPGVSFTVFEADPGNPVTLTVTESTNNATGKIENLVESYNQVVSFLKQALRFDPTQANQTNPTAGNSTLRNILTRLQSTFTGQVEGLPDGNTVRSLADLGVESQFSAGDASANGQLKFDEAQFKSVLAERYDDVIQFFEGIADEDIDGFADKGSELMESFLNTVDGVLTKRIEGLGQELAELNQEKADAFERLIKMEENLTQKFARLEGQMAKLNSQQSQLSAAVQSLQQNNTFIANRSGR